MSGTNIITANFARNKRQSITRKLYQGDYGQILRLKGIELPETFQAHFSNDKIIGTAKKVLGSNNEVTIPDEYLKSGTDIYVWVIIHSDVQDGETRYAITIPVIARPEATDIQPTPVQQDLITTAVAALNHALEKTEENVKHYPKIVSGYWFVYNAELDEYVNTNVDAHGIKGDTGNGISSAILNNDDTLTLTFTNGETYTTPSIKGRTPNITANREENTTSIYTDGYLIGHIYDGYSPSATVIKNNSTATISITDVNGTTTAQINDGATGATPNLTIGQINTLDPSESATATITGTNENPILNLGIPQGIKGNDGKIFYGTSNTSWNYSKKAVICPEVTELYPGLIIAVTFTNPGGPQRTMLNVNSLGDKGIYVDGVRAGDFDNNSFAWAAGATINFMYNGEGFNVISSPSAYYAVCSTASKTTQKLVYCPHSMVRKGTSIIIKFTYINTSSAAQLCVTEEEYGELAYLNGNPVSSSNTWKAGDTVTFVFDGLYWQGSTGPKGDKGDQGDDYVLTEQDKSDIANLVPPLLDIHEVPSGGTAGQVLKKSSGTDYDAGWADESDTVTDVQINGSSIVTDGVAEIPIASTSRLGLVKPNSMGVYVNGAGEMSVTKATSAQLKAGTGGYNVIVPVIQHESAFYALAKAAGDTTQSQSSNAVGNYTDSAKVAIQKMLGIYEAPWELIREDTFTNETEADHVITVDGNGEPFELTDAILTLIVPKHDENTNIGDYGRVYFYNGNTEIKRIYLLNSASKLITANATANTAICRLIQDHGLVFIDFYQWNTIQGRVNNQIVNFVDSNTTTSPIDVRPISYISKIKIGSITGQMQYRLFGKRKWN